MSNNQAVIKIFIYPVCCNIELISKINYHAVADVYRPVLCWTSLYPFTGLFMHMKNYFVLLASPDPLHTSEQATELQ